MSDHSPAECCGDRCVFCGGEVENPPKGMRKSDACLKCIHERDPLSRGDGMSLER
jgi:histone acetyltransferase (RNA polymerase elongator complex component)